MRLTPELAKKWLESMPEYQRHASRYTVNTYATDMANGRWMENTGDTIKFNKRGQMIDGQHRCLAVIHSGRAIKVTIATDLDESVFYVLDKGKKRTAADTLGGKNRNERAAIAKAIAALADGVTNRLVLTLVLNKENPITPIEVVEIAERMDAEIACILEGHIQLKRACNGSISVYVSTCLAAYAAERTGTLESYLAFCNDMAKPFQERPEICKLAKEKVMTFTSSKERSKNVTLFANLKVAFDHWLNGTVPSKIESNAVVRALNSVPLKRDWLAGYEKKAM